MSAARPPRDHPSANHGGDAVSPEASVINIPNFLSAVRFVGSFVLLGVAFWGNPAWVLPLMIVLLATDWVDGKLAILLRCTTTFGARLDSVADVTFYAAALITTLWLKFDLLWREVPWIAPAVLSYLASAAWGAYRFGRIPTYHTRMAKTSWFFATVALIALYSHEAVWPLRITAISVLLTNLEAIAMTSVLDRADVDIASLYHALRRRREKPAQTSNR